MEVEKLPDLEIDLTTLMNTPLSPLIDDYDDFSLSDPTLETLERLEKMVTMAVEHIVQLNNKIENLEKKLKN